MENMIADGGIWDERLRLALARTSGVAEDFRRLRTCILHPPDGGKPPRTILVVSAVSGEGKSFVSAGLAVSLARGLAEYALMIDCDLRRPSLASLFGQADEQGLADYLEYGEELPQLIRKTGMNKLSLIASGQPPANPSELLGSERLAAMVADVARRYSDRYIIFDSPPVLRAAETSVLARLVDGVVLVVREGRSRREDVRQALELVGPEKVVGVVYNGLSTGLVERQLNRVYGGDYYAPYYRKAEGE